MTNLKTKKLGSNPLDWIGKPNNIDSSSLTKEEPKSEIENNSQEEEKRETYVVKTHYSEKIKDYAYWERLKQKDAINMIFESFFKDKTIKPRPKQ